MIPGAPENLALAATAGAPSLAVLGQGLVVFARMLGVFAFAPFFGSMNIPMPVRVTLAFIIATAITPLVKDNVLLNGAEGPMFMLLLINQVLIGIFMGLAVAFVFFGIESAGRVIDTQRGSNMSDLVAPTIGDRTSPLGQWMMMVALVILLTSGQHLVMLTGFINSFETLPATLSFSWINEASVMKFAELSSNVLVITVAIAAPAMVSLLLSDVLLGIINRGAPQVNVFMFSLPIKAVLGIAAVLFALPLIVHHIDDNLLPEILGTGKNSLVELLGLMRGE